MKFEQVLSIPKGTKIGSHVVKGPGKSRGEPAIVYLIRSKKGGKPNEKRIRQSEWNAALQYIKAHGKFTLEAFRMTMPDAAKDGECNFHFTWKLLFHVAKRSKDRGDSKPSATSKTMPLIPELIPAPLWGRSAFRMLGRRVTWEKKIRPDALNQANNSCSLCGSSEGRLICHDKWQYDDKNAIATLVGFEIHCAACDAVTHVGRSMQTGPAKEVLLAVLNQLCRVNQCVPKVAEGILAAALEQWGKRNKKNWTIRVAAPLINQYPELAGLPEFVPQRTFA